MQETMRWMRRAHLPAIVTLLTATACGGDDAASPITARTLIITGGDEQSAIAGTALPDPLVVTVIGSDGRPLAGATVTWQVISGGGAVSPRSSTSDAAGEAQTTWSLGFEIGTQAVAASVPNVTPVTFAAEAIDPCSVSSAYSIGTVVNGSLATTDCLVLGAFYTDFYDLSTGVALSVSFAESSTAFDAFMLLHDEAGDPVAFNDDQPGTLDSRIWILMTSGTYFVAASSAFEFETGPYALSSTIVSADVAGCPEVWITRNVETDQIIESTDCVDESGPFYSDQFLVYLLAGETVTITQRSTEVDAFLQLFDSSGSLVDSDDDGAGGTDAQLIFTASSEDYYVIDAGTFDAADVGLYTLTLE